MGDLNEKLAQESAGLINGGEWRDGKWYSEGHRDAWRRALKPAADRIEKLEALVEQLRNDNSSMIDDYDTDFLRQGKRIEKLEAALRLYACDCKPDDGCGVEYYDGGANCGRTAQKALEGKDD